MRHFIDGRLIDDATQVLYSVVFRGGGDRATAPFGLTIIFLAT
jgi:hypothetical protein